MIVLSKNTKETPGEIIDRAVNYFGESGLGLTEVERGRSCISFEGGGGYVTVRCNEQALDVETREWDFQVKEFLATF